MMDLGPQFLYHGTHREIEGEHILPAAQTNHGTINFQGLSESDKAYATDQEDVAWQLADTANSLTNRHEARTRVHSVEPNKDMTLGVNHPNNPGFSGENLGEWTAPKFKVKDRIDIMPGRQGTLPVNWNQFRNRALRPRPWGGELNHPDDEDIEYGHYGTKMREESKRNYWGGSREIEQENLRNVRASGPEQMRLF